MLVNGRNGKCGLCWLVSQIIFWWIWIFFFFWQQWIGNGDCWVLSAGRIKSRWPTMTVCRSFMYVQDRIEIDPATRDNYIWFNTFSFCGRNWPEVDFLKSFIIDMPNCRWFFFYSNFIWFIMQWNVKSRFIYRLIGNNAFK